MATFLLKKNKEVFFCEKNENNGREHGRCVYFLRIYGSRCDLSNYSILTNG